MSEIVFDAVTPEVGLDLYRGESWGAAWGDVNGDGRPDVWVNNHVGRPSLLLNQADGTFVDVTSTVVDDRGAKDHHGAQWVDIDNDGDQDLIQLIGAGGGVGSSPSLFYINEGGQLINRAQVLGIDYPDSRGRMPLLFDFDNDGNLDVFFGASDRPDQQSPATIFRQTENGFEDVGESLGLEVDNAEFAKLIRVTEEGSPSLLVVGRNDRVVYDFSNGVLQDISGSVNTQLLNKNNFAVADFDGDLRQDIFQVTKGSGAELFRDRNNGFKTFFKTVAGEDLLQGGDFTTQGRVDFSFIGVTPEQIFIGASGINPSRTEFSLSADGSNVHGLAPFVPGTDTGLYVGYDVAAARWNLRWTGDSGKEVFGRLFSSKNISEIDRIGMLPRRVLKKDQLLLNRLNSGFQKIDQLGLNTASAGSSVAIGDFDNDMDEDIFVVSGSRVGNPGDILYENLGTGRFKEITLDAGVTGTREGVGTSAMTVDYDLDGFLDLFVLNGGAFLGQARPILSEDGPYELFRNQGNDNNWLEIDLEGRLSNRDGIGTRLVAKTEDNTQIRWQDGGIQRQVQNHSRIHFGMAQNTVANTLSLKWTSGISQTLTNVGVNQILKITEGVGTESRDIINGTDAQNTFSGGNERDVLRGLGGDDVLIGQNGNDRLIAGSGNDTLVGGLGKDFIRTGAGRDRIRYFTTLEGADEVIDFSAFVDRIEVNVTDFQGGLQVGGLKRSQFVVGTRAKDPNDRFIYDSQTGNLFFDGTGSIRGREDQILLATLTNQASLTHRNILLM